MSTLIQVADKKVYPLVSIVIPNFNHAHFIKDSICSVLNQDYSDFEIIVVDDGSTDHSREVVAPFGDKVRYIWQKNQGLSAARNTGIRAARGDFIGVLDADDMYEPQFLSAMISALQKRPDADGIYCGYQFVDEKNNLLPQIENRSYSEHEIYSALLDGNFLVPESMLVSRSCYERVGDFDETLRACEDWDMWLRITSQYKIINTPRILTRHRVLPGSMSSDPTRMLINRLAVLRKNLGAEPAVNEDPSGRKSRSYGRAYLGSCVEYLQYGDRTEAFMCLQKMALICPPLLTQVDTFYQLGCGDQPKGSMGHFVSIDLQNNAQVLITLLNQLFEQPETRDLLRDYRKAAYANAYLAMALLSYGARKFTETRMFLFNSATANPRVIFKSQSALLLLKSFVSPKLLDYIRNILKFR